MSDKIDADRQRAIFSKNLKYYMSRFGKNTADLATDLSYPFSTVSDWVHGKKYPRMDKVQALADYFGIMKSHLTEEDVTPLPSNEENADSLLSFSDSKKFIPERLQEAMGEMTCEEFVQMFDGDPKIISLYLEGKRNPNKITSYLMAKCLGVNPDWLYGLDVPKYENVIPLNERELSPIEQNLIRLFRELNQEGQERLVETADDMVSSGKYIKSSKNQLVEAQNT